MCTDRRCRRGIALRSTLRLASASLTIFQASIGFADPGEVDLKTLLTFAEAHAPRLKVAEARRRTADAELAGASVWLRDNPSLEVSAGPRTAAGASDFDLLVSLQQPFELGGQRGLRIDAAARQRERSSAELDVARWNLRVEIKRSFVEAWFAAERQKTARAALDLADRLGRALEQRLSAGDASAIEARLAEADRIEAASEAIVADAALASARLHLAELSGWPLSSPPIPRAVVEPSRPLPPLAELERAHPELSAARAAREVATARLALADREAWPTPSLGISAAKEGSAGGPASYIVLATLGVPLPIWDRNQGARLGAELELEAAEQELADNEQRVEARLRQAHARVLAAEAKRAVYETAAPLSSLELLRRGLEAGELSITEVSVARSRFLHLAAAELEARADVERARLELELAVGADIYTEETP